MCLVYRSFPEPLSLCGRYTGLGSKAICCPPQMLIGPLGAGVVGLLLQQAGGHVATRFPIGFCSPFHMQCMSYYSILLSLQKTHKTIRDNLELLLTPTKNSWFTEVQKLLTWISNILVLILPCCYQGPLRLCKTLFYEIME